MHESLKCPGRDNVKKTLTSIIMDNTFEDEIEFKQWISTDM